MGKPQTILDVHKFVPIESKPMCFMGHQDINVNPKLLNISCRPPGIFHGPRLRTTIGLTRRTIFLASKTFLINVFLAKAMQGLNLFGLFLINCVQSHFFFFLVHNVRERPYGL